MGTCAAIARPNGAFLNGSSSPVRLRVPSGNTTMDEVPSRIVRAASSYAANAFLRAARSIGMWPTARMAPPSRGILNNSCFATKRTDPGSVANNAQMSNIEEWLEARSEEHTSELQSLAYLVCRLLLEKKKKI